MWETDLCDLCRAEVPAETLRYVREGDGAEEAPVIAATCTDCSLSRAAFS